MLRGSSLESNSILNAVLIVHSHSFFHSLKTIPTSLLFRYKIFSLSTYLSMFNNFFQIPKKEFNISFSIMEPYSEGMLKAKVRGDAAEQPIGSKAIANVLQRVCALSREHLQRRKMVEAAQRREDYAFSLCLIYSSTLDLEFIQEIKKSSRSSFQIVSFYTCTGTRGIEL